MDLWTRNIFSGRLCVLSGVGGGRPCRQGDAWRQTLSREGYEREGARGMGGDATHEGNNKVAKGRGSGERTFILRNVKGGTGKE